MPRYIDADYADKLAKDLFKGQIGITYYQAVHAMLDAIKPVDAVSVVRCKNCANRGKKHQCPMMKMADDVHYGSWQDDTEDNYFCSFGERKDGEK